mgnify:CR=1 FL=1
MKRLPFLRATATAAVLLLGCQPVGAQSVAELVKHGDVSDLALHPGKALESYLAAERLDPKNVDVLLRIARQYRHLMTDATSNQEKLRLGEIALAYGRRSAALAPNDGEAQLCQAITYGKMLPFEKKQAQAEAVPLIRKAVDKAIRLDPRNDTAWHVLGRWHQSLANISGVRRTVGGVLYGTLPKGTHADALACFTKAIALNPNRSRHHIELGRTYAQMGELQPARRLIERGLAMPNSEKDDPEIKARGIATLAKML